MARTDVFETYQDFLNREDKRINGVSPDFAAAHPDYEADNATNSGCWNCEGSVDCVTCIECEGCIYCYECDYCYECVSCQWLKGTKTESIERGGIIAMIVKIMKALKIKS